jgi:membrane protease YdiL (CAAX protease family)
VIIGAGRATGAAVLFSFCIGGAATYALMRFVYAKAKAEGVPRILGDKTQALLGVAVGLLAAPRASSICTGSMHSICSTARCARASRTRPLGLWTLPLALIAAPLFEEFIFRGLIFGGLRRSFGIWPAALASAACCSPSCTRRFRSIPVFVLGVCAALVYDRTRSLLAPMIVHAVYNAVVIGAQTFLL